MSYDGLVESDLVDTPVNGRLVDMSLAQTSKAGLTYAVVPMPWMMDWFRYVQACNALNVGFRFEWHRYCGLPGWDFDANVTLLDGDGNYRLCLLEHDHEGECA